MRPAVHAARSVAARRGEAGSFGCSLYLRIQLTSTSYSLHRLTEVTHTDGFILYAGVARVSKCPHSK